MTSRESTMTAKRLREMADLVEKGDALVECHVTVDMETTRPMVGEIEHHGSYYATRRFVDTSIVITIKPLTDVEWQDPVTREWRTLESCKP